MRKSSSLYTQDFVARWQFTNSLQPLSPCLQLPNTLLKNCKDTLLVQGPLGLQATTTSWLSADQIEYICKQNMMKLSLSASHWLHCREISNSAAFVEIRENICIQTVCLPERLLSLVMMTQLQSLGVPVGHQQGYSPCLWHSELDGWLLLSALPVWLAYPLLMHA